ncbi:MAG: hypothetical protein O9264_02525 [Leptospira sp.]|nr:hypothetical protein [Leptospira sp.]
MIQILISDELLNGKISNQFNIDIDREELTAKQLIEKRVTLEVENYNKNISEYFNGLVEPLDAEKTLNGYKLKKRQMIDVEKQIYVALAAFQKNGFFILVDEVQIETLDQKINLNPSSKISFVKLTPLIGG